MARIEFPEETRRRIEQIGTADLVIGVAGTVDAQELRLRAASALAGMSGKIVVAYSDASADAAQGSETTTTTEFLPYPHETPEPGSTPWTQAASAHRAVLSLAANLEARACAVIHNDLGNFAPEPLALLTTPVLEGQADLVMPVYPESKYDGLLNKCMLAPLSQTLFGKRVRYPLAFDFGVSSQFIPRMADASAGRGSPVAPLMWPANQVATGGGVIEQARLASQHTMLTEGLDLTAVLTQLAGSLFQEVESCAAFWQRIRASHTMNTLGANLTQTPADVRPMDVRPMIESFSLATRNLEEIWRLVIPPVTLLELKRLARLDPQAFHMPDQLWVRAIYDFALGYRVRNISRQHLLGALTPLYLGWVASYATEMANASDEQAERRVEQLAQAFEENKPYLLARWRWPDRMNL
jgi:glucosylglycerate synthase